MIGQERSGSPPAVSCSSTDILCSSWQLLDRAPNGRGSPENFGDWPRRHDEYEEVIHAG